MARRAALPISKSDLRARPMLHRTCEAIEAHLIIGFHRLGRIWEVQNRTGLAVRNAPRHLRTLRSETRAINGTTLIFAPAITTEQQQFLTHSKAQNS